MTINQATRPFWQLEDGTMDPHLEAVLSGLANRSFGMRRAVSVLQSCGYTLAQARDAITTNMHANRRRA